MATTAPLGTIQGLASNIQWQDLITQIISGESTAKLSPVTKQMSTDSTAMSAWSQYQGLVGKVQDAAKALRDTAFDQMQSDVATDSAGRALASMTATSAATPGIYRAEVVSLASADKVGGGVVASATSALHLTGEFFVNGTKVTVADGDSLNAVRDKINAVNTGTGATSVAASVLTVGTTSNRLTLSTSQVGASGIQLADGSTGVLAALGLVPASGMAATTAAGGAQSFRFRDSTTPIGTLLGATTLPPSTTIDVGNTTITVDLATDSLDSIRGKIVAAGAGATLGTTTFNGTAMSTLDVSAPIAGVPGDAASQRIVDLLGFSNTRGAVAQSLANSSAWTATGGGAAGSGTLLSDLHIGGAGVNLVAGDSITLAGTRGDGVAVATTITLDGSETVQSLLDKINANSAFGSSTRAATASIAADGTLKLNDSTAGASQLALSMIVTKAAGGTATLGQMSTQTTGFDRQLNAGSDAAIRIDGTLITRSSNTISDAVPGVTFNLINAQPGTVADVHVARDTTAAVSAVKALVTAYNAAASFAKTQSSSTGQLPFNTSLRTSIRGLTTSLIQTLPGLSGTYTRAGTIGLTLDKTGQLQLDSDKLSAALTSDLPSVKALFGVTATTTTGLTYLSDTGKTKTGTYAVNITSAATKASVTGTGFAGTYTDSGVPDGVTITDGATLHTGHVSLATGDDVDTIAAKFNTEFTAQSMKLVASNVGGQLSISSTAYGSAAQFNLNVDGGATGPTTLLGLTTGNFAGTDVVGTIDGAAAVGSAQTLTGATGTNAEGLALLYTGAGASTGSISHTIGMAALMANASDNVTRSGDGLVAGITTALQAQIDSLNTRSVRVQARLDQHKAALTAQFTKMESAMATLQAQTAALTNQIKGLQQSTS